MVTPTGPQPSAAAAVAERSPVRDEPAVAGPVFEPLPAGLFGLSRRGMLASGCTAILLALVCFLSGGAVLLNQFLPGSSSGRIAQGAVVATQTSIAGTRDAMSTAVSTAGEIAASTSTVPGVPTPAGVAVTKEATAPRIVIISVIQDGDVYRVEYETIGFIESATGVHIHFFYNNIDPEDAGFPGPGPWFMHPGPRPFTGATVRDRPADATQICSLVADPDHRTYPDSGNCMDLPLSDASQTPALSVP